MNIKTAFPVVYWVVCTSLKYELCSFTLATLNFPFQIAELTLANDTETTIDFAYV